MWLAEGGRRGQTLAPVGQAPEPLQASRGCPLPQHSRQPWPLALGRQVPPWQPTKRIIKPLIHTCNYVCMSRVCIDLVAEPEVADTLLSCGRIPKLMQFAHFGLSIKALTGVTSSHRCGAVLRVRNLQQVSHTSEAASAGLGAFSATVATAFGTSSSFCREPQEF